ncbi:acyltransferase domain-containing protein [Streptomyces sp. S.PNR 29]|uniref:acyltransferase domain-containing protein n=1 Tax=Streptomyces sp. S.PNR 29 TaxID=2973805 RepID=UPI0025B209D8|nr:acyltransferase domain-containing protein [Streptomyces sp. S.PNR 29]MDN0194882.1 acyltransferase domain-containing protein [Streptomyces sp. S.PNR 29]
MLPDTDELPEILLDLAVPHEDINDMVALRRTLVSDAGTMRLLKECVEELLRDIGEIGREVRLDERLTEAPAALGPYFPAYVFVAALPHTRAYHRERGIPADVTRRTLADLGRNIAAHRRRTGGAGMKTPRWLTLHFRGELYQLGRLQFQRARLGQRTGQGIAAAGLDVAPGTPCLNLHIPDCSGPLSPAACDRSLTLAREFFVRHFPEERQRVATCHSWLLDRQLRRYLPEHSNILRFQERFRTAHEDTEPADTEPIRFVFGDPDLPVESLPRRTSVERAVGDHLRAGGHWYIGHGWFPL